MVMPALPGAHLVFVHPRFTLASFETGFNTGARFDDPRQLCERGRRQLHCGHPCRTEVVTIAIAAVLLRGIRRGLLLRRAVVREGTTGDHQPLLRSRAFVLQPRLHAACDHLNPHWAFLTVSHCQARPPMGAKRLSPGTHGLPRDLGTTAAPLI